MDTLLMLLTCCSLQIVTAKSTSGRDYGNATPSSSSATYREDDPPYSVLGFTDRDMYNYVMFGSICGCMFILVSTALICTACHQRKTPGSDTVTSA